MYEYKALVERWIDGDTVDLQIDLGFKIVYRQRARLVGINTPELRTKDKAERQRALDALNLANRHCPPGTIAIARSHKPEPDDKYGRWLVELDTPEGPLTKLLIDAGLGKPWDGNGERPV